MNITHSLHKIHKINELDFSPKDYSRFKFGDGTIAKIYGCDLAKYFINDYLINNPIIKQIVVLSSPYSFIPTASYEMKEAFLSTLNHWLVINDLNVAQEAKVVRSITYKDDYGALSAKERMNLISNDSFHIDKDFLINKTLVFLDDIKITGSHEKMITRMIENFKLENDVHLVYFAELLNLEIPPDFENYLNYASVKNIFDLQDIINGEKFKVNTRIVKYILNSSFSDFKTFIGNQKKDFILQLYNMSLGNSYHSIHEYQINLNYIKTEFILNNLIKL
jgi:hypothetical protein